MKKRPAIGGTIIVIAVVGLWSVTRLDFGLHPVMTGIGVITFVVGIIGGMMAAFGDGREA